MRLCVVDCGDVLVEKKQKSVSYYVNYTNVVGVLLARLMLLRRSNSGKVNHSWGMVVRLAPLNSTHNADCVYLCVHVGCICVSLHTGMGRLGVTVSFLYVQDSLAYSFSFDCWEVVPISIYNCVFLWVSGWKSKVFIATHFKRPSSTLHLSIFAFRI